MISFNSLLRHDGVCSIPVASGVLVFWCASGSCVRVPASFASLSECLRSVREWAWGWDSCVSCSFWVGGVLVARSWGGFAASLGACPASALWRSVAFVS